MENKMDFRKIIKFGNSSHIVSLPNNWIKKQSLKKGDVVYLTENGNNELILSSKIIEKKRPSCSTEININNKEMGWIKREIVSKYIAGYDLINISGQEVVARYNDEIKGILSGLVAMEVVEQTKDKIIAKDFVDENEVPLNSLIRRMDNMIRLMFSDLKTRYKTGPEYIYKIDSEVNKLTHLSLRIIKKHLGDKSSIYYKQNEDIDNLMLLSYWELVYSLERTADELKRISKNLNLSKLPEKKLSEFFELYNEVENDFTDAMKAYYKKDEVSSYEISNNSNKSVEKCVKFAEKNTSIPLAHCIEKLKTIESYIKTIVRLIYQL